MDAPEEQPDAELDLGPEGRIAVEQAEAGEHGDAAGEDEQEAEAVDDGCGPAEGAVLGSKADARGEDHSGEAGEDEKDADNVAEFDEWVVHATPFAIAEMGAGREVIGVA